MTSSFPFYCGPGGSGRPDGRLFLLRLLRGFGRIGRAGRWLILGPALALVAGYRLLLSPILPATCRFHPTCSAYADQALRRFGLGGIFLTLARLGRCHPWHPGGVDPVPATLPKIVAKNLLTKNLLMKSKETHHAR